MSAEAGGELAGALAAVRTFAAADPAVVSARGVEAVIAGATLGVSKKTWLLPGRRERACALVRGCPADRLDMARPYRVIPAGPSPVARAMQAVGLATAGDPALVFLGTGSVSYGTFAEALSLAAARSLPVTFVVSWYITEGPFGRQLAVPPSTLGDALGVASEWVDGTDAEAVRAAVSRLAGRPGLVEAQLTGKA